MQEPGQIKRLSVAVAVDGVTTFDAKGKMSYAPRSADEMNRINELVRSAVGFTQTRGDQVSVINVRFDRTDEAAGAAAGAPLFNFDKNDLMRVGELVVLLVMAGLVIFFVVRPLLATAGGGGMMMLAGPGGARAMIQGPGGEMVPAPVAGGMTSGALPSAAESRIDIAKIEGQVKASSVKAVSEFVEAHPDESISILRAWLHEA